MDPSARSAAQRAEAGHPAFRCQHKALQFREDAHSSLQQRELCTVPGSEGERPVRCGPHILDLLTSASPPGPPAKASA
uniref:Uncharacterized protein n=1 Tax=Rangifer tarandus platyrhynchus TaxID=3082113 RepID=A0ACB0F6W1_RANTA|nr:unnamed protein product [Rangifer tarandus platyrhynchus]